MPGLRLFGFPWVGLGWYLACAMVVSLSVLVPLVTFTRAVGGIFGWFFLCPGCGPDVIWLVCLLPGL